MQRQSEWYLLISGSSNLKQESKRPLVTINPTDDNDNDDDDSDDMIGPMPAEQESEEEDDDEFPISHEIILKDHSKVNSTEVCL